MEWQKKSRIMNQLTEEQLKGFASQLSHPTGENGIRTADQMHVNNIGMIRNSVKALTLDNDDRMLELGHGNGHHIPEIINAYKSIQYTGLEISELMSSEAEKLNTKENTSFTLYDGLTIPFEANSFSKIMTVNTLYFWENPSQLLDEIYRVLKPGGKFACTFAEKDFMEKLPFTKFIFKLYDREQVSTLFNQSHFNTVEFEEFTEQVWDREGNPVDRIYTLAILTK
ncbi:MAG: class I SAM-dependent methyltransferase [Chitinophagaceae bacterium]|nr:MAG: class I SAM-dependent methyltransferase [Chitinophagaceae bacterium]